MRKIFPLFLLFAIAMPLFFFHASSARAEDFPTSFESKKKPKPDPTPTPTPRPKPKPGPQDGGADG